jgi:hypothetical protein
MPNQNKVYLKTLINLADNKNSFCYSLDNITFKPIGETFPVWNAYWKGDKIGLFSFNDLKDGGWASFNWFRYVYDGPKYKGIDQ